MWYTDTFVDSPKKDYGISFAFGYSKRRFIGRQAICFLVCSFLAFVIATSINIGIIYIAFYVVKDTLPDYMNVYWELTSGKLLLYAFATYGVVSILPMILLYRANPNEMIRENAL